MNTRPSGPDFARVWRLRVATMLDIRILLRLNMRAACCHWVCHETCSGHRRKSLRRPEVLGTVVRSEGVARRMEVTCERRSWCNTVAVEARLSRTFDWFYGSDVEVNAPIVADHFIRAIYQVRRIVLRRMISPVVCSAARVRNGSRLLLLL